MLAKVGLCSRFDPVRVGAQKYVIGVQFHNLVFRVVPLDLQRQNPLIHFALERFYVFSSYLFARDKQVLGKLLRKRRPSLSFFAGEILPRGADDPNRIDANVIIKAHVLDRQNRCIPRKAGRVQHQKGGIKAS